MKSLPKNNYYRSLKNHQITTTTDLKKSKKFLKKKLFEIFWEIYFFYIFFKFFSENVFKTLLGGKKTIRKKYRIVFEKFTFFEKKSKKSLKKKVFRNFLTNLIFLIFLEFLAENILKSLLMGKETTSWKYWIVFEKFTFFEKKSKKSLKKKSCS